MGSQDALTQITFRDGDEVADPLRVAAVRLEIPTGVSHGTASQVFDKLVDEFSVRTSIEGRGSGNGEMLWDDDSVFVHGSQDDKRYTKQQFHTFGSAREVYEAVREAAISTNLIVGGPEWTTSVDPSTRRSVRKRVRSTRAIKDASRRHEVNSRVLSAAHRQNARKQLESLWRASMFSALKGGHNSEREQSSSLVVT